MFRVSIAPIIRSTSNCNCSFWYRSYHVSEQQPSASVATLAEGCTHDVAGRWPATSRVHYTTRCNTQSSAPEDGQNNCPKRVELTGIINKPLLLHLVVCLYYLYFIIFLRLAKQSQFIPRQNVVYFITLPFLARKIFTFYLNDVLLFKFPVPGPKG